MTWTQSSNSLASVRSWKNQAWVALARLHQGTEIMPSSTLWSLGVTHCPLGNGNAHSLVFFYTTQAMAFDWLMWMSWRNKDRARHLQAVGLLGCLSACMALQALRGGRGNGIYFVPLWLPPTKSRLKRLCFGKSSASSLCFIISPSFAVLFHCLYPDRVPGLFPHCVLTRLGVSPMSQPQLIH